MLTLSVCFAPPVCCVNGSGPVTTCTHSDPRKRRPAVKDHGAPRSVGAASSSVRCTGLRHHGQSLMTGIRRVTLRGQCAAQRVTTRETTQTMSTCCLTLTPPTPPTPILPRHPMCDSTNRKPEMKKESHPMMYPRTPSWIRRHTTPTLLFLTSTWRGVSYSKKKSERALVIWLFIFSHGLTRREEGLSLSSPHWHINTQDDHFSCRRWLLTASKRSSAFSCKRRLTHFI